MKRTYIAVIMTLLVVLCVSIGGTYLVLNWDDMFKTYSDGYCLNEKVTEDMSRIDIARLYTDSCVTVVVETSAPRGHGYRAHGSGVCIASKGYDINGDYIASKGSYFVTNYHVISYACDPLYDGYNTQIYIELNSSDTHYLASLLWANKDLDVAVVYSSELNEMSIGWIEMKDRFIACEEKDKVNYDEIFVIGTPLDLDYKNTLTLGNVSNNNFDLVELTGSNLYVYTQNREIKITQDPKATVGTTQTYEVIENVYENAIMINCDITNGNSGGGVFDKYGNLIGLATLGRDESSYAMNFIVPIYPVTLVLDKIILNNETNAKQKIFTPESMDLVVMDETEAFYASKRVTETGKVIDFVITANDQYYYYGSQLYSKAQYASAFNFEGDGVYVLRNGGVYGNITTDFIITGIDKNDLVKVDIKDRNDLLFYLLSCNQGDKINIYGKKLDGNSKSFTITL